MRNNELFEALRRVHEMHSSARGMDTEQLLAIVQNSKGDSTYSLTVAVAFKHLAGDNWDKFCQIYDTTRKNEELTIEQFKVFATEIKTFWHHVKRSKYYGEFLSVAAWYVMKQQGDLE